MLEFDVYLDAANPQFKGGFDAMLSVSGIVRSSGWVDQNGLSIHPGTDLSGYANGQWYHRTFAIGNKAGETLSTFKIAHEGDLAGAYTILLDNVRITNGGQVQRVIYENGFPLASLQAEGPTSDVAYQNTNRSMSYYDAGGQRVALRRAGYAETNGFKWLLTDHLGSTSITANKDGTLAAELRYKPWGETRYASGVTPTSYRFTGQREENGLGLYWYNSRFYDPALGRYAQADTLIPEASQGVQAWDRYAYVNNNPLRYNDPSGHDVGCHGKDGHECHSIDKDKNDRIEDLWDEADVDSVSDRTAAEQAFLLYLTNPEYFALLYLDPEAWATSVDVANLDAFLQYSSMHMTADELISSGFDLVVAENLDLAHFHHSIGDQEGMQDFLKAAGIVSIPSLIAKAGKLFPNKAGILEWHHYQPMYLGGSSQGVQYQIDAAYHQLITNEFRTQWGYGKGTQLTPQDVQNIMNKVYNIYPIPPGAPKR